MSTFDKVRDIISENLNIDSDKITPESNIFDDLGADSLDVMETVMALEESFDIKFPESDVKEIKTVGDLVSKIDAKK
jgi:acyl carrier protein